MNTEFNSVSRFNRGEYHYLCKQRGPKRERVNDDDTQVLTEEFRVIGTIVSQDANHETVEVTVEQPKVLRSTQKFECPVFIKVFNLAITSCEMMHSHPIMKAGTTYAIHRKQSLEIMQHISSILSSGQAGPVSSAKEV
ncbi:hypothetical protein A0J61_03869 [Choanephora cucurbitarum]|uniref:Uncharacterized protein n=1 Tax=Choanephora cucurbitarum TaxID=101091 RepID=A0A1C7NG28_9FUNG|nr:hypothetical protein A0J61_03869 [Choanephora cucurbitarum]